MNALTGATLLASTSISTPIGDDTELLVACASCAEAETAMDAVPDTDNVAHGVAMDRYHDIYDAVSNTRPKTLAGLKAKAALVRSGLLMMDVDEQDEEATEWEVRGAWRLVNDLLALDASPVSSDADLIAAGGEYLRIQREFEAYFITLDGDMEDNDPHWAILDPLPELRDKIATLRATTAEGFYARARCVAFHYTPEHKGCLDHPDGAAEDRFKAANLRDMVRAERGAPDNYAAPHPSPDGELLKACSAFCQAQADYDVANAKTGDNDETLDDLSDRWSAALGAVLTSRPPSTHAGRVALARAARIALLIGTGDLGPGGFEGNATPEHRMILMALSAFDGSAAA